MSRPWLVIAKREFLERVRTKWFAIATILGPIGMVAAIVIPALLGRVGAEKVRIALVDRSADVALQTALLSSFRSVGWTAELAPPDSKLESLQSRIAANEIDGFLTVPADALSNGTTVYRGDNASSPAVAATLEQIVGTAVLQRRAAGYGLSDTQRNALLSPVRFDAQHDSGQGQSSSGAAAMVVGYAVMFILYMAIILYGVNVMRSVVQEKTSRVVELLVAVTKPWSLLVGKIVGVGAVGLVQIGVWLGMSVLTLHFRAQLLGMLGAGGSGGFSVPPLQAPEIAIVLAYFIVGYFFYAAIFAALGAMVSSEQEAQQAATPVSLLLIVPLVSVSLITADPRGAASVLLTNVPLSSPLLMPMRYLLGGATFLDVVVSLGLLILATVGVAWLASRIYRVGILMYGKRPTLGELLRWIRYR